MIPGDLATRLRQLTENSVQPLSFIHKLPANLPELVPGQQFTARIHTPLPDGSFQALVAGKSITLALPHSVKSGDVLELIVTGQREQTLTAKLAPPPLPADDAPHSSLSQTGRLISQLLTGRFGEQRATALAAGEPLLPATPGKPQELTPRLQQAVAHSGLFYESHLKAWAEGRTALANLLREPHARYMPGKSPVGAQGAQAAQAALSELPADAHLSGGTGLQAALMPTPRGEAGPMLNMPYAEASTGQPLGDPEGAIMSPLAQPLSEASDAQESPQAPPVLPEEESTSAKETSGARAAQSPSAADANGAEELSNTTAETPKTGTQPGATSLGQASQRMPEQLMPLIYQQLETLATHQVQYQFQAWPGMNVEWEIVDPDHDDTAGTEAGKAWRSSIRLHLPALGDVDALLVLGPQGLSIRLDADSEASAARMREAGSTLLDALAGAGLLVNALSVSKHANA
ncbi:MAG: flagellar hook-length control protein FliK [Uliginosibacterium sp.]|nr:flagellar hook-length control protein FliK [Uliginosibacterium sp.]